MDLADLEVRKNSQPCNCKDFLTVSRRGEGVVSKANAQNSMLFHFTPYQEPSPRNNLARALQAVSLRREGSLEERQVSDRLQFYYVIHCWVLWFFFFNFILKSSKPVATHLIVYYFPSKYCQKSCPFILLDMQLIKSVRSTSFRLTCLFQSLSFTFVLLVRCRLVVIQKCSP